MNPTHVFSSRRRATAARIPALARTLSVLLTAASLGLSAVCSVSAEVKEPQIPGTRNIQGFSALSPIATVYAITSYSTDDNSTTAVFFGGENGYESIAQPDGTQKTNFVGSNVGNSNRIIFTAVPETVNLNAGESRKFLIGGLFGKFLDTFPAQNIARISLTGAVDASFSVGNGANNYVTSILPLKDGTAVVGGLFTSFNGLPRLRIVKLLKNGSIDPSFSATSLIDNDVLTMAEGIQPFASYPGGALRPDGTILVGGTFNRVGGLPITKLARLNANGTVDTTFHPVIDERVNAIVVQPSGKIIIGGQFTSVNGRPALHIARLNRDGSLDTTFTTFVTGLPLGEPNPVAVYVLKQLSSKGAFKLYVGGNFTQINGLTRRFLGFIDPNGKVESFDPGVTIYDKVQSLFVQPSGRVLVGQTLGPKIGDRFQDTLIRLYGATPTN